MQRDFQRVAIVNRGEPAMRLIHAVREFNQEHGTRLRTIALHTDPDRKSLFVREADESYNLGPAFTTDARDTLRRSTYLDYERLEEALLQTGADAAWVGWGFVAEHAAFADLCTKLGVVFIGPDAETMRRLGDKISAKRIAESAGVPVAPWSQGPVETFEQAREHAERLGYPLLVKASAGGGGRGIRRVASEAALREALPAAQAEAYRAFGDATVFLESLVLKARHVEVQIVGDTYGTIWALGVRDCSVQRRNQKIIEESPSPALDAEQHEELQGLAVEMARAVGYHNAGTVEFLYQPANQTFAFMEVNTRLQVEHPVTELTTGVDLVKLQLTVARGGRLVGNTPTTYGHAIEVRLCAEDPDNGYAPAPGTVELFRVPTGPWLRVDTGLTEGDTIAPEFDSMIAKLVAWGRTRSEALARLRRALYETAVVIRGGTSNKAFLLELIEHPDIAAGAVDVGWLDRLGLHETRGMRRYADLALVQVAIDAYDAELRAERIQFYSSAARGRPRLSHQLGLEVPLRYRGQSYELSVVRVGADRYQVESEGRRVEVLTETLNDFERRLTVQGRSYRVLTVVSGMQHLVEVEGVPHRIARDEGGILRSPAPAIVLSILVQPGDAVKGGDRLLVLEAMKMEMSVTAPYAGRVRQVVTIQNAQVDAGAPLLVLDQEEEQFEASADGRVRFDLGATPAQAAIGLEARCQRNLDALSSLMLGYDVDPSEARRLVAERAELCRELKGDAAALRDGDAVLMRMFVDIASIFRRPLRHHHDDEIEEVQRVSGEEYLFTYLKDLDARGQGLPASFLEKLQRTLLHYRAHSLDRTPELEEALFRLFKARQHFEQQVPVIHDILERHLERQEADGSRPLDGFSELLDGIAYVTHGQAPALGDLAREVRYRTFDQPLFETARKEVYRQASEHLSALATSTDPADREARVHWLVGCPQPLAGIYVPQLEHMSPGFRALLLEVLTRRYYRLRDLKNFQVLTSPERSVASAEYDYDGKHIHLLTTHGRYEDLPALARALQPAIAGFPAEHDVIVDFYLWRAVPASTSDLLEAELRSTLDAVFPVPIRRVVAAIAYEGRGPGMSSLDHFTFRGSAEGFLEDKALRGLHPIMAHRLELARLCNFDIQRLPSAEDVYLFYGVAKENSKDQRLFAFAEVRDLTPVRDETGRLLQLPHFERMFLEALAGIRRFQSHRPPGQRLHWNRVYFYVWPTFDFTIEEVEPLLRRMAPYTEGLGLEKVAARIRAFDPEAGAYRDRILELSNPTGIGFSARLVQLSDRPLRPLSDYDRKVVQMRQRGLVYPYEIVRMLTPPRRDAQAEFPPGEFVEHDLDYAERLVPVDRPHGQNTANVVVGVLRSYTPLHPEGMARVVLLGDPSRAMGSLDQPEARRIIQALDLAEQMRVPVDWFAVSAGAKIAMDVGTEGLDWMARVLRRIIEFTQAGGEINVVVHGVNVGAQSYWNGEATMLMHTRGILIMTPEGSMLLTGKRALEYSGSVSAEDNQGIGGYEHVMGLNGQAQYYAADVEEACRILMQHYEFTYVAPGERFPRRATTSDPIGRDVRSFLHGAEGFERIGDLFSDASNPGRKRPFDIRRVMLAASDQDAHPLERWANMRDAETAVVWDTRIGGHGVCLIGFESRRLARLSFGPSDGPDHWTSGTLFPQSSKKVARAINSASGNRPVVLLANLSGFDGSPESMRELQLEFGSEIGRAVVNFKGPIVTCVISRYHGGAYVVFSRVLNENFEVAALEGTYASVIGGAPAAAVVFSREVEERARKDPRIQALEKEIAASTEPQKSRLRSQMSTLYKAVHSEKLGQMAEEFDHVHDVHRALQVGSLHRILPPAQLRPYIVDALERGMRREVERWQAACGKQVK
jgi:acetyl/propionyl-CoA carboxylase alpha subunit/acetyl-CoA carboxylase carboxyltransferase component